MNTVYLLCGVPASGKSWVISQLASKFNIVEHDLYKATVVDQVKKTISLRKANSNPILLDCPFGETKLREALQAQGITVVPYFIVETPEVVSKRYEVREKKPLPNNVRTRATTIADRAKEWNAPSGTSEEVLEMLRKV